MWFDWCLYFGLSAHHFRHDSTDRPMNFCIKWETLLQGHIHIVFSRSSTYVQHRTYRSCYPSEHIYWSGSFFISGLWVLSWWWILTMWTPFSLWNFSTIQFALDHAADWDVISFNRMYFFLHAAFHSPFLSSAPFSVSVFVCLSFPFLFLKSFFLSPWERCC